MREQFYVERKQGDFCKNKESDKGKYGEITQRTACREYRCRCENKMVPNATEYTRLIASILEPPVCSFGFIPFKTHSIATWFWLTML